tara:strand:- start:420 stop:776 length:357 start_codon:yes stop_codon:yes gene_type:complete
MKYDIKWETNSRVRKNPKISNQDIIKHRYSQRGKDDTAVVKMTNVSKEYPLMNIFFTCNGSSSEQFWLHENTDKACTAYPSLIVSVDSDPENQSVEFSTHVNNRKEIMKVIEKVLETV